MGADFLSAYIPIPEGGFDFVAAHKAVTALEDDEEHESGQNLKARLFNALGVIEVAAKGESRSASIVTFVCPKGDEFNVLLTGGMSWGDSPTEEFDAIIDIGDVGPVWKALTRGQWD